MTWGLYLWKSTCMCRTWSPFFLGGGSSQALVCTQLVNACSLVLMYVMVDLNGGG